MKNSTRKLLAILATITMALSVTVSQAPPSTDLSIPPEEVVEAEEDSEDREPDCEPNCEDDYEKDGINKY
ncbi:MAG: hypothetical protein LUF29_02135 [Oscillospiraceae bacterium]|nr:hypothetical protein [Oscillospiraceae bacterium]